MSGHAAFATPAQRTTHLPRRHLTVVRKHTLKEENKEGQEAVSPEPGRDLTLLELQGILEATLTEIEFTEDLTASGTKALRDNDGEYQGNGGVHPSEKAGACETGETTASLTSEMWRRHSLLHAARKNLEAAIVALKKGEVNTYYTGYCIRCGDFIGVKRLSAVPETLVCYNCG